MLPNALTFIKTFLIAPISSQPLIDQNPHDEKVVLVILPTDDGILEITSSSCTGKGYG